jgi:uncharacterized protein (DUF2345 family)
MSLKPILFSAALLAAALAATAAGAQGQQPQTPAGDQPSAQQQTQPRETTGSAIRESFAKPATPLRLDGIVACGSPHASLACGKLEPLLAK